MLPSAAHGRGLVLRARVEALLRVGDVRRRLLWRSRQDLGLVRAPLHVPLERAHAEVAAAVRALL